MKVLKASASTNLSTELLRRGKQLIRETTYITWQKKKKVALKLEGAEKAVT